MKIQLFAIVTPLLLLTCNSTSEETSAAQGPPQSDLPQAALSYTGKPLNRFEQEIQNMKKADSNRTAQENEVLFTGSSSIRMWNTLAQDFDPIPGINRGFGGSILPEVIHYADRIIFPYQPKLIVLYCGENDVADGATAVQVLTSFIQLDEMIRSKLPETKMIYISMKPSIARWKLWEEYSIGNEIIHEYIKTKKDRFYMDCSTVMLLKNGEPDPSIFIEDNLHMNATGYEGWTTLLKPMVEKLYN
jgi:lysophospholipase L1-like esterase